MLRKQGHGLLTSWSDRWCVLKGNVLTYYKKPNTPELGALSLKVVGAPLPLSLSDWLLVHRRLTSPHSRIASSG